MNFKKTQMLFHRLAVCLLCLCMFANALLPFATAVFFVQNEKSWPGNEICTSRIGASKGLATLSVSKNRRTISGKTPASHWRHCIACPVCHIDLGLPPAAQQGILRTIKQLSGIDQCETSHLGRHTRNFYLARAPPA
ncbi:DUF2946 family protein [Undibacterium sp. SXout11W]|uniref:DUF2946 family protein n=1 Tax=Undibacterium sp. SXout11W TaxID=3413050 RepID=UPI003BEF83CF